MTKKQKIDAALDVLRRKGLNHYTTDDGYFNIVEYDGLSVKCISLDVFGESKLGRVLRVGKRLMQLFKLYQSIKTNESFPVTVRITADGVYCRDECEFNRYEENMKCCKLFDAELLESEDDFRYLRCEECLKKQIEWEGK